MTSNLHSAQRARRSLQQMLLRIEAAAEELGRLDAPIGDGDHGTGMVRGLRAANAAVLSMNDDTAPASTLFTEAGYAFSDAAGGASGALIGTFFVTFGQTLGDQPCTPGSVHNALNAGLQAVCDMGQSKPGDKTLIDTLDPFTRALGSAVNEGAALADAWQQALPAAQAGARSTADMISRRGRSSRLGERSLGHPDPGAISVLYMLEAVGETLRGE